MKFLSTTGKEHKIDIRPSRWPRRTEEKCKSRIQWGASVILDELYPGDYILEEFFIPGERLYIDFFLPRRKLAVEVQGKQHYEYNRFFHGSKASFKESKIRDRRKSEWCKINGIRLVIVKYNDKEEEIKTKLK